MTEREWWADIDGRWFKPFPSAATAGQWIKNTRDWRRGGYVVMRHPSESTGDRLRFDGWESVFSALAEPHTTETAPSRPTSAELPNDPPGPKDLP